MPSLLRLLALSESTIPNPRSLLLFIRGPSLGLLIKVSGKRLNCTHQYRNPKVQNLALPLFHVYKISLLS